jgi:hypothetical protein
MLAFCLLSTARGAYSALSLDDVERKAAHPDRDPDRIITE